MSGSSLNFFGVSVIPSFFAHLRLSLNYLFIVLKSVCQELWKQYTLKFVLEFSPETTFVSTLF